MDRPELTILTPCLNEELTLGPVIEAAKAALEKWNVQGEILVSDNGSTDRSQEIAKNLGARVTITNHKGYGNALIHGINQARGRYVIMLDCDGSYDFDQLDKFLEKLRNGADVVMGSRFRGQIKPGAMPLLNRYVGNPILSFMARTFFSSKISDFHCGIRAFNRQKILELNLMSEGMEFATEFVALAELADLKIDEVPVTLSPDGRNRPPHLSPIRDGWRHLRFMLTYCPKWLFLWPGVAALSLSLCLSMAILIAGRLSIGSIHFSHNTLVYLAFATIFSIQNILYFVIAKHHGTKNQIFKVDRFAETAFRFMASNYSGVWGVAISFAGLLILATGLVIWQSKFHWQQIPAGYLTPYLVFGGTLFIGGAQFLFSCLFAAILSLDERSTKIVEESVYEHHHKNAS